MSGGVGMPPERNPVVLDRTLGPLLHHNADYICPAGLTRSVELPSAE